MVSSPNTRAAFITSAMVYMDQWGFQGIDLDWEYPGALGRGGRELSDTKNFSLLVREMRAAFGKKYGISVTLSPDYWYLRWFDAKAMEPHMDWFGFMAYDLPGTQIPRRSERVCLARPIFARSPTTQCRSGSTASTPPRSTSAWPCTDRDILWLIRPVTTLAARSQGPASRRPARTLRALCLY